MTTPMITIEGLGKKYVLGEDHQRSLRETLSSIVKMRWRRKQPREEHWALRNVSFQVNEGEVIGIIGLNGAGKSTLLKLLSRITEPTEGRAALRGRVASLLEVGTGFHSELTGRENIFLNGAILGMTKSEIKASFDEIVAFADIPGFLDTPVKRYSSGMYVRLAFAVAAHLRPEILIIDEVLAVGDVAFQAKCLSKMGEAASSGRTILFVSHNLNVVEQICKRVVVLERGRVGGVFDNPRDGVNRYLQGGGNSISTKWSNPEGRHANEHFVPLTVEVETEAGGAISNAKPIKLSLTLKVLQPDAALQIGFGIRDEKGQLLFKMITTDTHPETWPKLRPGVGTLSVTIPPHLLNEGSYRVELISCLFNRRWLISHDESAAVVHFTVRGGLSPSPYWAERRDGIMAPLCQWSFAATE